MGLGWAHMETLLAFLAYRTLEGGGGERKTNTSVWSRETSAV